MKRKMLALLLTMCMVLGMVPATAFAAPAFGDTDGHWAEEAIGRWAEYGIVSGMNGGFNPDGEMTRAQAAAVFANLFGLTKKADVSGFTDVEDTWYVDAIAKCVAAGIMSGVGNGKMDPNGTLTREQMFTMFANGLGIKPEAKSDKEFADADKTSGWAQGYINALANRGFVSGTGDNKLAPEQNINRASVMALIDASVATYVTEDGEVEAPKDGGLVIVLAENVTITGEFSGTVLAVGGDTTIKVEDATAEAEIVVASGSENVSVEGKFAGIVTVAAKEAEVAVENAAKVEVATEGAKVEVTGTVKEVAVTEEAKDTKVEVAKDAKVENVVTNAANTTVAGEGKVEKVEAKEESTGTVVNTTGSKVENTSKEDVTVGTGSVNSGSTGTSAGETSKPTTGTTTGGSTGGSSRPSHNHAYGEWGTNNNGTHTRPSTCGHAAQTQNCTYVDGVCSVCGFKEGAVAMIGETYYTSLEEAIDFANENGESTVLLLFDAPGEGTAGGYSLAALQQKSGFTLDGNGKTLTVTNADGTWDCAIYTNGGTIKNMTINGAFRGIFTGQLNSALYVDNCVLDKICYTFNADGGLTKPVVFTNTTLNGWTSYSGTSQVTFENCSFGRGTGGYTYAYLRPYTKTVIRNCEFAEGYELDARQTNDIYIYNCTVNGVKITEDNLVELLGADAANAKIRTVEDGIVYNEDGTVIYGVTSDFNKTELVIKDSVREIGAQAFKNTALTKVVFNKGLESIGYQAFCKTYSLTSIEFSSTVKNIGSEAFRLSAMETLVIPETVTVVSDGAFRDMPNLTKVTVEGNAVIGNYAWRTCANLEKIYFLGEEVTFAGTSQLFTHADNGTTDGITVYVANETVAEDLNAAQAGANKGYVVVIAQEVCDGIFKTGPKNYEVVSAEGLMNLDSVLGQIYLGEGMGAVVNLACDIDMTGKVWTPINRMWVTYNGNGHTISNLNCTKDAVGRSGFLGYAGAVTVNNLTLENVTAAGSQAGTFAGAAEGFKTTNCVLKGENAVSYEKTEETWNGIGAITGLLQVSAVDVTISEGAKVTVDYNGMTTAEGCTYVDKYTGFLSANGGMIVDSGEVTTVNDTFTNPVVEEVVEEEEVVE